MGLISIDNSLVQMTSKGSEWVKKYYENTLGDDEFQKMRKERRFLTVLGLVGSVVALGVLILIIYLIFR